MNVQNLAKICCIYYVRESQKETTIFFEKVVVFLFSYLFALLSSLFS